MLTDVHCRRGLPSSLRQRVTQSRWHAWRCSARNTLNEHQSDIRYSMLMTEFDKLLIVKGQVRWIYFFESLVVTSDFTVEVTSLTGFGEWRDESWMWSRCLQSSLYAHTFTDWVAWCETCKHSNWNIMWTIVDHIHTWSSSAINITLITSQSNMFISLTPKYRCNSAAL